MINKKSESKAICVPYREGYSLFSVVLVSEVTNWFWFSSAAMLEWKALFLCLETLRKDCVISTQYTFFIKTIL